MNKPKAGLISIINSPGGGDELDFMVVTPELYEKIKEVIERDSVWDTATSWNVSNEIMELLYPVNEETQMGEKTPEILYEHFMMSWGRENINWMNRYEFIGMIPIETY